MDNPKCPYCIHCDAPIEKIDYTAELDTFEARGGTVITYVKVEAFCHWCGTELYVPAVNDMNKLSRDNAYAAAMKQDRARGEWIERIDEYPDGNVATVDWYCSVCGEYGSDDYNYCPNCGAEMRKDGNDER